MAASSWVKVSGVWRQITQIWVKVSGTWRSVQRGYSKVAGVWELTFVHLTPFTQDFTTPGGVSGTVPIGAGTLTIGVCGAGGGGIGNAPPTFNTYPTNGAGAGATALRTITIQPSDWGTSFSGIVGTAGTARPPGSAASAGTASTFSISVSAGSFSLTGNGANSGGVTPATASGGTSNINGGVRNGSTNAGGDSFYATGGASNTSGTLGSGGGGGGPGTSAGGNGGNGRVKLDWS